MPAGEDIKSVIESLRKVSDDGALVTYDLTSGVDFSNPRKVADALAIVFFEKDAVNWFKVSGDHIEFDPTCKVRVVLAEEHSKRLDETVDDFLEDLKEKEIYQKFSQHIDDAASRASRLKAAMVRGSLTSLITKHLDRKIDRDFLEDDLFLDILEKLEIRSLDNKDLMDWKHLPI